MYIEFDESQTTKNRLVAVHPYRTAKIAHTLIRMEDDYDNETQVLISDWLAIAAEKGLITSTFGTNHIVFEFENGILVSYSDFRIAIGTGLLRGNW